MSPSEKRWADLSLFSSPALNTGWCFTTPTQEAGLDPRKASGQGHVTQSVVSDTHRNKYVHQLHVTAGPNMDTELLKSSKSLGECGGFRSYPVTHSSTQGPHCSTQNENLLFLLLQRHYNFGSLTVF